MFKTTTSTKYTEIPNNIIPSSAGSQLKTQAQKLKEEVAVLMKQENDLAEIQKLQHDKYVLEDSIKKRKEELGSK